MRVHTLLRWIFLTVCCAWGFAEISRKSSLDKHVTEDKPVNTPSKDDIARAFETMIRQKLSQDVASNTVPSPTVTTCTPISFSTLRNTFTLHGDPNPNYVAMTQEESTLFPNFFWERKKKDKYVNILKIMKDRVLRWAGRNLIRLFNFRRMLERKLRLPQSRYLRIFGRNSGRIKRQITSGNSVTTIRDCYNAGSVDSATQDVRICTSCMATTVLPENRFPRYINEVICKASAPVCFQGEGKCGQRLFSMTFMYKTGNCIPITQDGKTIYIEEWIPSQQSIGTCCECQIKSDSWIKYLL